ncbi:hypothetical protein FRB95_013541 [Tulasnella sp. JGI-2019a]|nr:hypothetical protein FRB95_013541 [Tulasnella sp. JGI-2019a]
MDYCYTIQSQGKLTMFFDQAKSCVKRPYWPGQMMEWCQIFRKRPLFWAKAKRDWDKETSESGSSRDPYSDSKDRVWDHGLMTKQLPEEVKKGNPGPSWVSTPLIPKQPSPAMMPDPIPQGGRSSTLWQGPSPVAIREPLPRWLEQEDCPQPK